MKLKEIWKESNEIVNEAVSEEDIRRLRILNIKLIQKFKNLGIKNITLTSLGNSIALGVSKEGIIKPIFDRNTSLDDIVTNFNFDIKKYTLARNSNINNINNWLLDNISLKDISLMEQIPMTSENICIEDILKNEDTNIIIYNGCSLRKTDTINKLKKDIAILRFLLSRVEYYNRLYNTNTEVYVSGIPNIKIFNNKIKKTTEKYACANYVKPVDCDMFDKEGLNFKYNEQQYIRYNLSIMKSIYDNYLYTEALIDIDRSNADVRVINGWIDILKYHHYNIKEFKKRVNDKILIKK